MAYFIERDDLLPCPFCGVMPYIIRHDESSSWKYRLVADHKFDCYFRQMNGVYSGAAFSTDNLDRCVKIWNKRIAD